MRWLAAVAMIPLAWGAGAPGGKVRNAAARVDLARKYDNSHLLASIQGQ
jgi:hypothetical protein